MAAHEVQAVDESKLEDVEDYSESALTDEHTRVASSIDRVDLPAQRLQFSTPSSGEPRNSVAKATNESALGSAPPNADVLQSLLALRAGRTREPLSDSRQQAHGR
ncbi:hypothetical protein AB1Y20_000825 [Prymnesium parvum]|uniref:Uncharacterized protein n=1 Tax=Prymnesium parvum TaxID=97485 RepID=A0AB34K941_PRYPA